MISAYVFIPFGFLVFGLCVMMYGEYLRRKEAEAYTEIYWDEAVIQKRYAGFLKSVILSGEQWSEQCEYENFKKRINSHGQE